MISIFRNTTIPALEQTLKFAEARHNVLAGNVANLDTPGYIARDLSVTDFQAALDAALKEPEPSSSYTDAATNTAVDQVGDDIERLLYHDGSMLNLERQVTELAKNQERHSLRWH